MSAITRRLREENDVLRKRVAELEKRSGIAMNKRNGKPEMLGDAPIEDDYIEMMNRLAVALDGMFNGDAKGADRTTGFVLMVFPFEGREGRCNYISNGAGRKDIIVLMKEMIARFEGQPELEGHA
jgi:hypothetical protein